MRVSWKWLSELVDLSGVTPAELAEKLTRRGLEVEAVEPQGAGFEKVVTAKILSRDKHPQADKLSLCSVSLGHGDPLRIVCGAQNMKAGDTVALAQIGAILPNGLKIGESKIRGEASFGMLCSEEELRLKDESEGILILPEGTPLGEPLAEVLGRDDTILVFKLTANRGDCLSHWGMAREAGAALGRKPRRPEAPAIVAGKSPIALSLDAGEQAPQFWGVAIDGVKIGSSPAWVVRRLEALGQRSINNVVDATNLVMLELGHPVHAYDADKIEGHSIRVRLAKAGEALPLLDGTTLKLEGWELVIADGASGARAVGLAGVMGGGNSEVAPATTRLFLECAEFDAVLVRRASSKHQKKTEASHRFERGIDSAGLGFVMARLAKLVTELAGGQVVGAVAAGKPMVQKPVSVSSAYFEKFLGLKVTPTQARQVLTGLDMTVEEAGGEWRVTPPSYRRDLAIREDLAEELARSLGYDSIAETLPPLSSPPLSVAADGPQARLALLDRAKDALARVGLSEALNYSFTSRAWLARVGREYESAAALVMNPLSEEHEALVPSLLPGLLGSAIENWNRHFGSEPLPLRLFEIRPVFTKGAPVEGGSQTETGFDEKWRLAFALSGPRWNSDLRAECGELDLADVKGLFESLLTALGTKGVRLLPMAESRTGGHPLFHPGQSVEILAGNAVAGAFGLLHPGKARELKARAPLWLCELDWEALAKLSRPAYSARPYKAWPQFPPIERDFALVVKEGVTSDKITQAALKAGRPLAKVAKIFDIYRGSQVAEGMTSVAVRVIFYDENRSLQEAEAESASAKILEAWKKELGAELRG